MRKRRTFLFVDGYNIINYWSELKSLMNSIGLDAAREELIDILGEYQELSGEKVILVFDAHMVSGGVRAIEKRNGIKIVYTEERETADAYIERKASTITHRDRIKVATSDGMIQQTILSTGGIRVSSHELKTDYEQLKNNMRRIVKRNKLKHNRGINDLDPKFQQLLDNLQKEIEEE